MRVLLCALTLYGCVSSSIQLGDDASQRDAGDGGGLDGGVRDGGGGDAGADAPCAMAVPFPFACFDGCTEVEPVVDALTCEVRCDPPAAGCFRDCSEGQTCVVGAECCEDPPCALEARTAEGQRFYTELCGEPAVIDAGYFAQCIEGQCELADITSCAPEEDVCVKVLGGEECGPPIALPEAEVQGYVDGICPDDGRTLPACCAVLGTEVGAAECSDDGFCE